jgi:hypothetical protein
MKAKHCLLLELQTMAGLAGATPIQADGPAKLVTPNLSREIRNAPGKSADRRGGHSPARGRSLLHRHAESAYRP